MFPSSPDSQPLGKKLKSEAYIEISSNYLFLKIYYLSPTESQPKLSFLPELFSDRSQNLMKLGKIAHKLDCKLRGPDDLEITGVAGIEEAQVRRSFGMRRA